MAKVNGFRNQNLSYCCCQTEQFNYRSNTKDPGLGNTSNFESRYKMQQRRAEQVSRILIERENISHFGGEESEEEIDVVEGAESEEEVDVVGGINSDDEEIDVTDLGPEDNDIVNFSKVIGPAASSHTPLQVWSTLFTHEILEIILKYTNIEIERFGTGKNTSESASYQTVTLNELKAFIGLLYLCGVQNNNKASLSEIWSREFGSTLCKVTMSQRRFIFISCRLRFDDKKTRRARRAADMLASIREIWDIFLKNCQNNYSPGQFLIIRDQLLAFRGHFAARVHMTSKSARFGIKLISMYDTKTFYMYNSIPYTGKVPTVRTKDVSFYFVCKLSEPIHNTNRNIRYNNFYNSTEMHDKMKQEFNLSVEGDLRSLGTDVFDELYENYSCARKTGRWSMRFFLGMLDQASVNGCILYNFLPENENKNKKMFLKDLALSLVKPHLKERATKPGLHKSLNNSIREILSLNEVRQPMLASSKLEKKKRCYFCNNVKDRKTQSCCMKCKKPVCDEHRIVYCQHCME